MYAVKAISDEENSTLHLEKFHSTGATNDSMQKMLKAFLQSAPQLLLQMYILISSSPGQQDTYTSTWIFVAENSIGSSVLCWI